MVALSSAVTTMLIWLAPAWRPLTTAVSLSSAGVLFITTLSAAGEVGVAVTVTELVPLGTEAV